MLDGSSLAFLMLLFPSGYDLWFKVLGQVLSFPNIPMHLSQIQDQRLAKGQWAVDQNLLYGAGGGF